ncbi:hypothetical protein [Streptomyces sp. CAU 1734]|uniref:hypothetical protein n=1 Tax=Streptomyces sp. CAU 1734 TaxID=3140360 RepID=UPI0032600DFC
MTRVLVNGTDVGLVAAGSIRVRVRDDDVTTVTVTLIPSRLEIRGEHADGERTQPRAGFTAKLT